MGPFFYSLTHGATLGSIFCVIFIFVNYPLINDVGLSLNSGEKSQ